MIVSVVHQKGGVGKTTTSINLASALALSNKRVLLVDMDPQAHSTKGLGVVLGDSSLSVKDIMLKEATALFAQYWEGDVREVILGGPREGLDLVPSEIRLSQALEELYARCGKNFRESILAKSLIPVKGSYDYIVIDCPPGLGLLAINAIKAAQFLLIPSIMSRLSIDSITDLLNLVKRLRGDSFEDYRILLTLVDPRLRATNEYIMEELSSYKSKVLRTQITRNETINQAQIAHQDIFAFAPGSRGAEDYAKLAKELLKLWEG
jgi:chromosome partitioning protein